MWPLKKTVKAPKPKVEVWAIPGEKEEQFCELYDAAMASKGMLETVRFWRFAEALLEQAGGTIMPLPRSVRVVFPSHHPAMELTKLPEKQEKGQK